MQMAKSFFLCYLRCTAVLSKAFFSTDISSVFFSLPDCNKINMHNFAIAFTLVTLNVFGAEAHHQTHLLNPEVLINTLHS